MQFIAVRKRPLELLLELLGDGGSNSTKKIVGQLTSLRKCTKGRRDIHPVNTMGLEVRARNRDLATLAFHALQISLVTNKVERPARRASSIRKSRRQKH